MNTNPYTPPLAELGVAPLRWVGSTIVAIVLLYPLIALTSLYVTWGLATLQLGRPPIPYNEQPDGFAIMVSGSATAILHVLAPLAVPVGFVVSILFPFARVHTSSSVFLRTASSLAYTGICAVVIFVLLHDPYRVAEWFWD